MSDQRSLSAALPPPHSRPARSQVVLLLGIFSFVAACTDGPVDLVIQQSALGPPGGRGILWEQPWVARAALWQTSGGKVSKDDAIAKAPVGWSVAAGGDFDGDGHGDVLWLDSATKLGSMWRLQGSSLVSFANIGPFDSVTCQLLTGDFNGDGKSDILQTTCEGGGGGAGFRSRVWLTDDIGQVHAASAGFQNAPALPVAAADFNNDGRSDVIFRNGTSATIWTMNADGSHATLTPGTATTPWQIVGAGDLDSNGIAEIVWWNQDTGHVSTWQLTATGSLLRWDTPWQVSLDWKPALVADIGGDGIADILWRHSTNLVSIWKMGSPTSVLEFGPGQPSGPDWIIRGVTPLAVQPPSPPTLPAVVSPSPLSPKATKILVVPCRFSDRADQTSIPAISAVMNNQIVPYYKTISYGAMVPQFTIAQQWFPLGPFATELATARMESRTAEVDHCVDQAAGMFNLSSFDIRVAVWNFDGDGTSVDGDNSPDSYDPAGQQGNRVALGPSVLGGAWGTITQEINHTFGLPHSRSEDAVEYGDNWDAMSCGGCFSFNLNAVMRKALVGLPANRSQTLTSGGRLVFAAMDRPDAPGFLSTEFDIVENGVTIPYFIEYHALGGLDLSPNIARDSVLLHRQTAGTSFLMGRIGTGDPNWAPSEPLQSKMGNLVVTTEQVAPVSGWAIVNVTKN